MSTFQKIVAYSITLLLFYSIGLFAAETITMSNGDDYSSDLPKIRIADQAECVETLENNFSIKKIIQNGLSALSQVNGSVSAEDRLSCVSQALDQKLKDIQMASNSGSGYGGGYSDNDYENTPQFDPAKMKKYQELEQKTSCFQSKYDALDSYDKEDLKNYTCSKTGIVPDDKAVMAEFQKIKDEYDAWTKKSAKALTEKANITKVLYKVSNIDQQEKNDLYKKLYCYNPYEKGSYDYKDHEDSYKEQCGGKWDSKEENHAIKQKYQNLADEYNTKSSAYNNESSLSSSVLYQKLMDGSVPEEVLKNAKTVRCYNPFKEGSYQYEDLKYEAGDDCENNWVKDKAVAQAAAEKIRAAFKDLSADIENKKKERDEAVSKKYDNYALARLLAKYRAHVKNGGDAEGFDKFCADYYALQIRDKKYAESGYTVRMFRDEDEWKMARDHGLTEAELSGVKDYTGSYYGTINSVIRQDKLDDKTKLYLEVTNRGLERMPSYSGNPDNGYTVNRFASLSDTRVNPKDSILSDYKKGEVVTWHTFASTSKNKHKWSGSQRFTIYPGNRGKDVQSISHYESEEEVLIMANSKFLVLDEKKDDSGKTEFVLAEVDESGNVISEHAKKRMAELGISGPKTAVASNMAEQKLKITATSPPVETASSVVAPNQDVKPVNEPAQEVTLSPPDQAAKPAPAAVELKATAASDKAEESDESENLKEADQAANQVEAKEAPASTVAKKKAKTKTKTNYNKKPSYKKKKKNPVKKKPPAKSGFYN